MNQNEMSGNGTGTSHTMERCQHVVSLWLLHHWWIVELVCR